MKKRQLLTAAVLCTAFLAGGTTALAADSATIHTGVYVDGIDMSGMTRTEALDALNAITHRFVGEEIDRILNQAERSGCPLAAIDAIALIESGVADRCDTLVAVVAPAEVRVHRIMEREGLSEDYARARVDAQKEEAFFRAHCQYVLVNDGPDPEAFAAQARVLFQQLLT